MLIATWNLDRPVSPARRERLRAELDRVSADLLVLTETHDGFAHGYSHEHSSAPGRDGADAPEHRWVTICSRRPLEPLATSDDEPTAAPRMILDGTSIVVYGTVLPWTGSVWRDHSWNSGEAFRASLALQLADWRRLRADHRDAELIVAGDFNQDLVGSHYYGSATNRRALVAAPTAADLVAWTGGEHDPIHRDSPDCACIDHIAGRADPRWSLRSTTRWPEAPRPVAEMSDHFGVGVVVSREREALAGGHPRGLARAMIGAACPGRHLAHVE